MTILILTSHFTQIIKNKFANINASCSIKKIPNAQISDLFRSHCTLTRASILQRCQWKDLTHTSSS